MRTIGKCEKKKCLACDKDISVRQFYSSNSPLHADHLVPWCKKCIFKNVLDSDGRLDKNKCKSVLRQIDKPFHIKYINAARDELSRKNQFLNGDVDDYGQKIFQLYMKNIQSLPQLRKETYADSDTEDRTYAEKLEESNTKSIQKKKEKQTSNTSQKTFSKIYSQKWRGEYTQEDIDYLDNYYLGLERDYKIVTENHRDYAKKIAKASLQMDKTFDDMKNNVAGADAKYKAAREAFDTLSKSAKFSESTRSVNDVGASSFSKVCAMVESHNWIPEYHPMEKDTVDELIDYLSTITKSL